MDKLLHFITGMVIFLIANCFMNFANYTDIGHYFFPKGFKRMVVRDWQNCK